MSTTTDHLDPSNHAGPTAGDVQIFDARPNGTGEQTTRSPRRRWPYLAAAGVVAAGAGVAIVAASSDEGAAPAEPIVLSTATAEVVDLVEFTDLDGTMTYAATTTTTASADGLITELGVAGTRLERGDVAYAVDGRPVVVLYGDVPLYRELVEGTEGDDVLLLEQHLAALDHHVAELDDDGHPVDEGFTVDGVFDDETTEAVERWQDDLGVEPTGVVLPGDALVLAGPSVVTDTSVDVGDRVTPGAPILTLNQVGIVTAGPATVAGGEIDVFVSTGQSVASGDVLFAIEDEPFTAVVTDVEFSRDIEPGIDPGDDVRVIEEMLVALGYDAGGNLVVDDTYDDATEAAIENWQEDLQNTFEEVDIDGGIDLDELVVVAPETIVGDLTLGDDDSVVASGTLLWTTTVDTNERIVSTAIPVADQDQMPVGAEVTVEMPDGEEVSGVVSTVSTASTVDPTDPDGTPELAVDVVLASVPESIAGFAELDVTVKLIDEIAAGVTAVPASALVATGDGGYAVEVLEGGATRFVAVQPGMFNDGMVEVDGIGPGTEVVVAS